jgi:hypothetical protein
MTVEWMGDWMVVVRVEGISGKAMSSSGELQSEGRP